MLIGNFIPVEIVIQENQDEAARISEEFAIEENNKRARMEFQILDEIEPEPEISIYMGNYELTAYVATGNPCADGIYPSSGYTAACNDPSLWHKWIHIEGYGDYYVHDTGGMANNVIDIFMDSYDQAIQFGRREAEVYIIEN